MSAATGLHSNVVINLKAREAVALADLLIDARTTDPDAVAAVTKVRAAADRAQIPWAARAENGQPESKP